MRFVPNFCHPIFPPYPRCSSLHRTARSQTVASARRSLAARRMSHVRIIHHNSNCILLVQLEFIHIHVVENSRFHVCKHITPMQCKAYLASALSPDLEHSQSSSSPSLSFLQLSKVPLPKFSTLHPPIARLCSSIFIPFPVLQRIHRPHHDFRWYSNIKNSPSPSFTPFPLTTMPTPSRQVL